MSRLNLRSLFTKPTQIPLELLPTNHLPTGLTLLRCCSGKMFPLGLCEEYFFSFFCKYHLTPSDPVGHDDDDLQWSIMLLFLNSCSVLCWLATFGTSNYFVQDARLSLFSRIHVFYVQLFFFSWFRTLKKTTKKNRLYRWMTQVGCESEVLVWCVFKWRYEWFWHSTLNMTFILWCFTWF